MAVLVTAAASAGVRSLYCQVTKVVAVAGAVKGDGEHEPLTVMVNGVKRRLVPPIVYG